MQTLTASEPSSSSPSAALHVDVVAALGDHLAVDLVEEVIDRVEVEGVRAELVPGDNVLVDDCTAEPSSAGDAGSVRALPDRAALREAREAPGALPALSPPPPPSPPCPSDHPPSAHNALGASAAHRSIPRARNSARTANPTAHPCEMTP